MIAGRLFEPRTNSGAKTMARATLDDLLNEPGKAELIGGKIVHYAAVGYRPNRVIGRLLRSLAEHAERIGRGDALTASVGYAVPELASGRESFSPDVSYYEGPSLTNFMRFIGDPPTLAVEVRSESDYTPLAEREIVAKRLDYFEAGTAVVWDVDPIAETISVYRSANPDAPIVYTRGQTAEAEPAVPGWVVDVDWVFS
jgi:Uma2 family endonuclease